MVGQQGQVHHFRIRHQHIGRILSDFAPVIITGIPVINSAFGSRLTKSVRPAFKTFQLIPGQGFQWKNIEGTCIPVFGKSLKYGQIVYQAFTARRGGAYNDMPAFANGVDGIDLMGIKFFDSKCFQGGPEAV